MKSNHLFILILLLLINAACARSPTETATVNGEYLQRTSVDCLVTPYSAKRPPESHAVSFTETWYGDQALWAGLSPAYDGKWYAGPNGVKVLWYRALPGTLTITGKLLDSSSIDLQANVLDGYGDSGIQSSELVFPTEGCWEVIGRVDDQELRFVVRVYPAANHPIQ